MGYIMWKLPSTEKTTIAQVITFWLIIEPCTQKNPISVTPKGKHINHCMMNASERIILENIPTNIRKCVPFGTVFDNN